MSSTGKAFVKSFARRGQSNSATSIASQQASPAQTDWSADSAQARVAGDMLSGATKRSMILSAGDQADGEQVPNQQTSGDQVSAGGPRQATSDQTMLRFDAGSTPVAQPHWHPASLQHTHTAYESLGPLKAGELIARSHPDKVPPTDADPDSGHASEADHSQDPTPQAHDRPSAPVAQSAATFFRAADPVTDPVADPVADHAADGAQGTPTSGLDHPATDAKPHLHAATQSSTDTADFQRSIQQKNDLMDVPAPAGYADAAREAILETTFDPSNVQDALTLESTRGSQPTQQPEAAKVFRPTWEVDVFDVPTAVSSLFFDEPLFRDLAARLSDAARDGLRTMLLTSAAAGEGRTTVAIGMALAAASTGIRVALVDADLAAPSLADDLRLELDHGWMEHVGRGLPMKEVAVHAVEDNLTLIPLLPARSGKRPSASQAARMIQSLKPSFDLLIIDGPTAQDAADMRTFGSAIDSVVIVHDVTQSGPGSADLLAARLQRSGIDGVGIVENFA